MGICFTLSQQDNNKCLACNDRLGNAVVTVKATKHMSSRLCADTWLAEYMQEPESGKFFTGDDECFSVPTESAMGFAWALIWPRVVTESVQSDMTVQLPYFTMYSCVCSPRILIVGKCPAFFLLPQGSHRLQKLWWVPASGTDTD